MANRITLAELRGKFSSWGWPKYPRGSTYLDEYTAKWLWARAQQPPASAALGAATATVQGAGFGEPEANALVERAAINCVRRHLEKNGYKITSREAERIGYDLDAISGSKTLHIEVKGISGLLPQFPITAAEVRQARTDEAFWLFAVTEARTKRPKIHSFTGKELIKSFALTPIAYIAHRRRPRTALAFILERRAGARSCGFAGMPCGAVD